MKKAILIIINDEIMCEIKRNDEMAACLKGNNERNENDIETRKKMA